MEPHPTGPVVMHDEIQVVGQTGVTMIDLSHVRQSYTPIDRLKKG